MTLEMVWKLASILEMYASADLDAISSTSIYDVNASLKIKTSTVDYSTRKTVEHSYKL